VVSQAVVSAAVQAIDVHYPNYDVVDVVRPRVLDETIGGETMRPILATLLALATAAGAWAHDEPAQPEPPPQVIQVAPEAQHGDVIPLLADVPAECMKAWAVMPGPNGLTLILAIGTAEGVRLESHVIAIGPQPGPNVNPTPPGPDVEPTPASTLEVWVIEESSDRTPAQGRTMLSLPWRTYLKDNGHSLRLTDKDAPTAPATLPGELPCVVGYGPGDDEPRFRAALPKDGAGMLELVKGWAK
jgi:hypothetical protein